jgi:hypothetical protein
MMGDGVDPGRLAGQETSRTADAGGMRPAGPSGGPSPGKEGPVDPDLQDRFNRHFIDDNLSIREKAELSQHLDQAAQAGRAPERPDGMSQQDYVQKMADLREARHLEGRIAKYKRGDQMDLAEQLELADAVRRPRQRGAADMVDPGPYSPKRRRLEQLRQIRDHLLPPRDAEGYDRAVSELDAQYRRCTTPEQQQRFFDHVEKVANFQRQFGNSLDLRGRYNLWEPGEGPARRLQNAEYYARKADWKAAARMLDMDYTAWARAKEISARVAGAGRLTLKYWWVPLVALGAFEAYTRWSKKDDDTRPGLQDLMRTERTEREKGAQPEKPLVMPQIDLAKRHPEEWRVQLADLQSGRFDWALGGALRVVSGTEKPTDNNIRDAALDNPNHEDWKNRSGHEKAIHRAEIRLVEELLSAPDGPLKDNPEHREKFLHASFPNMQRLLPPGGGSPSYTEAFTRLKAFEITFTGAFRDDDQSSPALEARLDAIQAAVQTTVTKVETERQTREALAKEREKREAQLAREELISGKYKWILKYDVAREDLDTLKPEAWKGKLHYETEYLTSMKFVLAHAEAGNNIWVGNVLSQSGGGPCDKSIGLRNQRVQEIKRLLTYYPQLLPSGVTDRQNAWDRIEGKGKKPPKPLETASQELARIKPFAVKVGGLQFKNVGESIRPGD